MAKDRTKETVEEELGMVLYSDGGSRDGNPGNAGYGIHGYLYANVKPTKGSGNLTHLLTANGYIPKTEGSDKEVKPIKYIDSFGSFSIPASNNTAELVGASSGFFIADKYPIKNLTLFTDSKYVVNGCNEWLPKWIEKDFVRQDGSLITNKQEWLLTNDNLNKLKDKGVNINVEWVKGHNGNFGNELADRGATIGVMHSRAKNHRSETDFTEPTGYWSPKIERHPFLFSKMVYFNTKKDFIEEGKYFLGDHGKDDDFIGAKDADGAIAYVELKDKCELIEIIRNAQLNLSNGDEVFCMAKIDKLFKPEVYQDLHRYKDVCLFRPFNRTLDLYYIDRSSDKEPLTREVNPAKLSSNISSYISALKGVLYAWQSKEDEGIVDTDITEIFYELDNKGNVKLKDSISTGIDSVKTEILYGPKANPSKRNLELFFRVDMPDRNAFKRLEKMNPKVYLLSWLESKQALRYALVIKAQEDIGIWSASCSNLKILP